MRLETIHPLMPPVIADTTNHRDPRQIAAVAAALFTFWDLRRSQSGLPMTSSEGQGWQAYLPYGR